MSTEPFIGEIKLLAFNFAPRSYMTCQGQIMSIAQNTALFALIGTIYGGDGQVTFALPDLRSRVIVGQGQGPGLSPYNIGQASGTENTTLLTSNLPFHTHPAQLNVNNAAAAVAVPAAGSSLAAAKDINGDNTSIYTATAPNTALSGTSITVGPIGGNQPVNNLQPYLGLNYSIAVEGIFPSRN